MSNLIAFHTSIEKEAGCDEAGRGCLAGPVVAAAVILPANFDHEYLNDSKKLTASRRMLLRELIMEHSITFGIGMASVEEIDTINILNASFLAMHRAIDALSFTPEILLIDGNRFTKYQSVKHHCIISGDAIYRSIAAASILAKTERDLLMMQLDNDFSCYNWKQNKGYPTIEHRKMIAENGISTHHRKTFNMGLQLKVDFI